MKARAIAMFSHVSSGSFWTGGSALMTSSDMVIARLGGEMQDDPIYVALATAHQDHLNLSFSELI